MEHKQQPKACGWVKVCNVGIAGRVLCMCVVSKNCVKKECKEMYEHSRK